MNRPTTTPAPGRRPSLPRLERSTIEPRNRMARRRAPLQLELAGRPGTLALRPCEPGRAPRDGLVDLPVEWGMAPLRVRLRPRSLGDLVQQALGTDLPDEVPALLRRAMVEAALGAAMTQLERTCGRRLHLVEGRAAESPTVRHGIDWQLQIDGLVSEGELWTDDAGLQQLAANWTPVPLGHGGAGTENEHEGLVEGFEDQPIVLRLAVGWVDLPAGELATLREHDVLLLDETWLRPDGGIALRVGRDSALIGRIDGTRIVITQGWTDIMDDRMEDDEFDDEFDDDFDDEDEDDDEDDGDDDEEDRAGLDDDEFDDDDDEEDEFDDGAGQVPAVPADVAGPDDRPRRLPAQPPAAQALQPAPVAAELAATAPDVAVVAAAPAATTAVRPAPATRRSVARHLGTLPVRLSFDLGQRTLTLAQLRDIGPGHVFELGRDLRRCVVVRANGRPIGEGELVDIDGRLGVSLVSLAGAAR